MYRIELLGKEQIKFINYMAETYHLQPEYINYISQTNQLQSNNNINFLLKYKRDDKKCMIYPGYGKFKWILNDDIFEIDFFEEGKLKATSDNLEYFTRLYIYHDNLEKLHNLTQIAFNYISNIEEKDKVKIYINKCNQYCSNWDTYDVINVQTLENIFIDKKLKENIIKNIDNFISLKDKYHKYGRNHKLNLLLTGIPGSGKTSLCKAIAKKYGFPIYIMNFTKNMTDSYMIELVSDIKNNSIILYEDIDVFFTERHSNDINVSFSTLINILDGTLSKGSGIINIITTNYPNKMDNALLRPGRIDKIIHFDYPKKEEIKEAFISLIDSDKKFEAFYDNIKNIKCSMAGIIDYLFRHHDDYLDKNNIQELISQTNFIQTITKEETCYKLYS